MTTKSVPLPVPLKVGDQTLFSLDLRRPTAGELRGIKLQSIIDMDVTTITVVAARVSSPPIPEACMSAMDPANLLPLATAIADFFLTHPQSPTTP